MRKFIIATAAICLVALGVRAQTNEGSATPIVINPVNNTTSAVADTGKAPTAAEAAQQLWDAVTGGQTNWYLTVDGIYAPSEAEHWGARAGLFYKLVQNNILIGPQLVYINGAVYVASANVTFQLPIHPIKKLEWLTVTPLVDFGSGATFGSKATKVIGIAEAGGAITIGGTKDNRWKFGIAATIGKWAGLQGTIYSGGPYVNFNF